MPSLKNSEKQTYTVPQAGEVLGIGRSAAYQGVHTGEIPSIKIGNRIVIPKAALDRMLNEAGKSTSDTGA